MSSSTPPPKPTFEELCKRAEEVVEHRSKSYVEDAMAMARWILSDGKTLLTNLTSVQMRCTQLLDENRALKRQVSPSDSGVAVMIQEYPVPDDREDVPRFVPSTFLDEKTGR